MKNGAMNKPDKKKRSLIRRFIVSYLKALIGLVAGGIILLLILWGALQTPFAQHWLGSMLSDVLSSDSSMVKIQGIHGRLPFYIKIDSIEIADTNGPCISVEKIKVQIDGWALLQRTVHIETFRIARLQMSRLPASENEQEAAAGPIPWAAIPIIRLDEFELATCHIEQAEKNTRFSLQGHGSFRLGRAGLVLKLLAKGDVQGSFALHGALSPVPSGLNFSLSMESEHLAFQQYSLDAQTGTLQMRVRGKAITGDYSLNIERDGYEIRSSGTFQKDTDQWALPWIEVKAPAIYIGGSLARPAGQTFMQGECKGAFDNLSYVAKMWDLDFDGQGDFYVGLNGQGTQQNLTIGLHGRQLRYHDVHIDRLSLTSKGDLRSQAITLDSSGDFMTDYKIHVDGSVSLHDTFRMDIDTCNGVYGQTHLALMNPMFFEYTTNTIHLSPTHLSLGTGMVSCAGYLNPDNVDVDLSISNLPLSAVYIVNQWVSQGELEGHLNLKGAPAKPYLDAQLSMMDVKSQHTILAEFPPVQIQGIIHIETNHLAGAFEVDGDFVGSIKSDIDVPCIFQLLPSPVFKIETNAFIQASLNSTLQMSLLNRLPMADDMKFAGLISLDLYHQGSVNDGITTGAFSLVDGSFRYFPLGTHITNITIEAKASGRHLVLTSARATDLDKGYITATGHVALLPREHFPYSIRTLIEDTKVIQRKDLSVMASGDLTVSGTSRQLAIAGVTKIEEAILHLDQIESNEGVMQHSIYDEVALVETVKIAKTTSQPFPVSIDIEINNPGNFATRGRGFDSLWEGTLHISLKNQDILLIGYMKTRRGSYRFLGRPFVISEGEIRFDGVIPPDPILDIHSIYSRTDLTADLAVLGRVSDPEFILSSTPVIPEDEIISQILFGKSMSTITPMQALTVASAVAQMQGKGNTFAFMDKTRDILGIDQLEVQESGSEKGEAELVAGKYVADGLYLEVNTALGSSGGTQVSAEYELTPHLTIETDAGANMRPGIGFNWKRDY